MPGTMASGILNIKSSHSISLDSITIGFQECFYYKTGVFDWDEDKIMLLQQPILRGGSESIKCLSGDNLFPFSLHIPAYSSSSSSVRGRDFKFSFEIVVSCRVSLCKFPFKTTIEVDYDPAVATHPSFYPEVANSEPWVPIKSDEERYGRDPQGTRDSPGVASNGGNNENSGSSSNTSRNEYPSSNVNMNAPIGNTSEHSPLRNLDTISPEDPSNIQAGEVEMQIINAPTGNTTEPSPLPNVSTISPEDPLTSSAEDVEIQNINAPIENTREPSPLRNFSSVSPEGLLASLAEYTEIQSINEPIENTREHSPLRNVDTISPEDPLISPAEDSEMQSINAPIGNAREHSLLRNFSSVSPEDLLASIAENSEMQIINTFIENIGEHSPPRNVSTISPEDPLTSSAEDVEVQIISTFIENIGEHSPPRNVSTISPEDPLTSSAEDVEVQIISTFIENIGEHSPPRNVSTISPEDPLTSSAEDVEVQIINAPIENTREPSPLLNVSAISPEGILVSLAEYTDTNTPIRNSGESSPLHNSSPHLSDIPLTSQAEGIEFKNKSRVSLGNTFLRVISLLRNILPVYPRPSRNNQASERNHSYEPQIPSSSSPQPPPPPPPHPSDTDRANENSGRFPRTYPMVQMARYFGSDMPPSFEESRQIATYEKIVDRGTAVVSLKRTYYNIYDPRRILVTVTFHSAFYENVWLNGPPKVHAVLRRLVKVTHHVHNRTTCKKVSENSDYMSPTQVFKIVGEEAYTLEAEDPALYARLCLSVPVKERFVIGIESPLCKVEYTLTVYMKEFLWDIRSSNWGFHKSKLVEVPIFFSTLKDGEICHPSSLLSHSPPLVPGVRVLNIRDQGAELISDTETVPSYASE
ncbi:hypothetical protein PHYBLDRAFT_145624 [Phycomyces blakesleeanus NRRL 1555(-)]|uniref:Uncharacterized protein n=1 Tax=Phycomyces blakesleeanus (strain ATCC 8743b / DSM 1359 / FGSC 10004 / NBRC 33097 / NRRL 1555) TaxID=763407 RepID=A0A163AFX3_PHYB8|nr:hypothetical protein PHYBLDRAFT_145624 [Phycomyces blakesleeanus NRRL 1555(-)]OAD73221.1 hypothetical protein PHYBLDRAFT_145624 [Phycomyces blakesleeanus NRRL 1555(-)]|eukprot:XP_018291261.1 hypothetical protein PHYBLDRAFT_145624 [Phycomyces blakesleeanus NRRL 1555(-)]